MLVVNMAVLVLVSGMLGGGTATLTTLDEKLKVAGMEFARWTQPDRPAQAFADLADAFAGGQADPSVARGAANVSAVVTAAPGSRFYYSALPDGHPTATAVGAAFYVDAEDGSDSNSGTVESPLRSIAAAVNRSRQHSHGSPPGTIILRAGTHYMGAAGLGTIQLSAADSGLAFIAFPGEEVWISGATPLSNLSWSPAHNLSNRLGAGHNVWVASTRDLLTHPFTGLRSGHSRLTRARYPNNNVGESFMGQTFRPDGVHGNWSAPAWCPQGRCTNPPQRFEPTPAEGGPSRANESRSGTSYILGYGGDGCSQYTPAAGFNCVDNQRWGGQVPRWPAGFTADRTILPNTPYTFADLSHPRNPAWVNGWMGQGWFTRHFEIAAYDAATNNFTYGRGGFQGAEGTDEDGPLFLGVLLSSLSV